MNEPTPTLGKKISLAIFFAILLLFVLNIFTPLRLNTDGIRYLNIVEYFNGNLGSNSTAAHDYLPHGYPRLLYLLGQLHLLRPTVITLLNIFSVFAACYLLGCLFEIKNKPLYFSLVMLSFILIKHATLPVSDEVFMFLFILSIYLWDRFFKRQRHFIILALITTIISIYLRTAGAAIFIGVLLYLCYLKRSFFLKKKIAIAVAILLLTGICIGLICNLTILEKKITYVQQLDFELIVKKPYNIIERFLIHIKEIGEVTLNIPYSKLSVLINFHGLDIAAILLIIVGLATLYIFYRVVKHEKLYQSLGFWICLSYLIMIFLWPYYDARFLIPIVPVFIFTLYYHLSSLARSRFIKFIPIIIYVVFGLVSMLYADAISLSKPFFLTHYGFDPALTRQYQIHFSNQKLNKAAKPVYDINKDNTLYLLEKYDLKPFHLGDK